MRRYSKKLYEKAAILKAAYAFTDVMYIHIDVELDDYIIELSSKTNEPDEELYSKFENELIMQEVRRIVSEKTKNIREMIVARALSSTIIDTKSQMENDENENNNEEILMDWFEKYDEEVET